MNSKVERRAQKGRKPKPARKPISIADGNYPQFIAISDAVEFIHLRLGPIQGEPDRALRDKYRKRLQYSARVGKIATDDAGLLKFRDVAVLLHKWFRGKFDDLPISWATAALRMPGIKMRAYASPRPTTVKECHAVIADQAKLIHGLSEENEKLRAENQALAPDANRYREICRTNRWNGGSNESK